MEASAILTEVETAGLVLAVLPLFIPALGHDNDSLDLIRAFFGYDSQLSIQIKKLRNRYIHCEPTLRLLLCPIADLDRVAAMTADPNGELWNHDEMQTRLEERLQESYHTYHETIMHMEEVMKRLVKDIKIDDCVRVSVI